MTTGPIENDPLNRALNRIDDFCYRHPILGPPIQICFFLMALGLIVFVPLLVLIALALAIIHLPDLIGIVR